MTTVLECIACGGPLDRLWLQIPTVALHRCGTCETLTALPRPSGDAQADRHDSAAYFDHPYFEKRRDQTRTLDRCRAVFELLGKRIDVRQLAGARMLDVGCDTGTFLAAASRLYGLTPVGLDVAQRSVAAAVAAGIEAYCAPLEQAPADLGQFRVITAIDVIEHVPDPVTLLAHVGRHLEAQGVCYLETPNIRSTVYGVGRLLARTVPRSASIARLFPAEHIQYFSVAGLRAAAQRARLTLVDCGTRPLPRADLGVGFATGCGLGALQIIDRLAGTEILHWAVLKRDLSYSDRADGRWAPSA